MASILDTYKDKTVTFEHVFPINYYEGDIEPSEDTIFVFGSNPEGRHGAGSAKVARERFGAAYGVGEGLTGNAYALPTKDLRIPGTRNIPKEKIIESIGRLYEVARSMPDRQFKVAYRTKADEASLNGYTGLEMARMFMEHAIPSNIWFSKDWEPLFNPPSPIFVNHSGGAVGSDTYWGVIGARYGVISYHYWHGKKTPNGNVEISLQEYEEGEDRVRKANETLHRRPERFMNLLARNWMQVKNAEEVFAVGRFKNKMVDGGTGWAVQMAIDCGKPVNFYDQEKCVWGRHADGRWERVDTPVLTVDFAGIGTRHLNENGKRAIEDAYHKTFGT